MKEPRIVELDGLRGTAALIVVVSHYLGESPHGIRALALGWLGVHVFFVLSGFLIGSIILDQHERPDFLKNFYLRRAARIVPIYVLVCAATLAAIALTQGHAWTDHPFGAGVYALFGSNVVMSIWGGGGAWLLPTWTLAVEEQFYLLLPAVIMLTPKRRLMPVLGALWVAATLFRASAAPGNSLAALSLLPARMDLLLAGVLMALVKRRFDLEPHLIPLRAAPLAAMILLMGVALGPPLLFVIAGPTLASVGIACFLLAIMLGAPEGKRYRSPVLRYFGRISYALYLVHQPISGLLHGLLLDSAPDVGTLAQLAVTILAAGVSVAVATASWHWFENPILTRSRAYRAALPATGAIQA